MPPRRQTHAEEQKRSTSPAPSEASSVSSSEALSVAPSAAGSAAFKTPATLPRSPVRRSLPHAAAKQLKSTDAEIEALSRRIAQIEASIEGVKIKKVAVAKEAVDQQGLSQEKPYFECAPILHEGVSRIPNEEAPEWYQKLLPDTQTTWNFPPTEPKNGHLGPVYDVILQNLREKASGLKGDLRLTYEGYIDEWKTLRQSVLYTVVVGGALSQINSVIAASNGAIVDEDTSDLSECLLYLEELAANLASDQIKRASVILFASYYTAQGAKKLVTAVQDTTVGFHPELLKNVRELHQPKEQKKGDPEADSADSRKEEAQYAQFPPKKPGSTTWKPANKTRDGAHANAKSPSKLSSPRKQGDGNGG